MVYDQRAFSMVTRSHRPPTLSAHGCDLRFWVQAVTLASLCSALNFLGLDLGLREFKFPVTRYYVHSNHAVENRYTESVCETLSTFQMTLLIH